VPSPDTSLARIVSQSVNALASTFTGQLSGCRAAAVDYASIPFDAIFTDEQVSRMML